MTSSLIGCMLGFGLALPAHSDESVEPVAFESSLLPPGLESLTMWESTPDEVFEILGRDEKGDHLRIALRDGSGRVRFTTYVWRSRAWSEGHASDAPLLPEVFEAYESIRISFVTIDGRQRLSTIEGYTYGPNGICERVEALDADPQTSTCADGVPPLSDDQRCAAAEDQTVRVFCKRFDHSATSRGAGEADSGERFIYEINP